MEQISKTDRMTIINSKTSPLVSAQVLRNPPGFAGSLLSTSAEKKIIASQYRPGAKSPQADSYVAGKRYGKGIKMEDLLQVGVITTTHGLRGEVKVFPTTDDASRFKKLKQVILDDGKEKREMEVASVRFFKNLVILKFKGIDDINDVEKYRKAGLYVTRENAVELKENEYFIADLIGLSAVSDEGEELGVITDVLTTGANDVYVIGQSGKPDLLVPAIKDCIKNVDLEEKKMLIHLLPGLREEK